MTTVFYSLYTHFILSFLSEQLGSDGKETNRIWETHGSNGGPDTDNPDQYFVVFFRLSKGVP
jgi:hypothetical protein